MNRLFVTFAAVLAAAPAYAEDYYVGASLGAYSYEEPGFEISESAIGIYAGWKILPNVAVEGQWIHWSSGSDVFVPAQDFFDVLEIDSVDTLALYAKPSLTVSEGFDLYAKLGFARMSSKIDVTIITPVGCGFAGGCQDVQRFTIKDSDTDVVWAVGGEYNMKNAFSLRAEIVGFDIAEETAYTYLLSVHYRFD